VLLWCSTRSYVLNNSVDVSELYTTPLFTSFKITYSLSPPHPRGCTGNEQIAKDGQCGNNGSCIVIGLPSFPIGNNGCDGSSLSVNPSSTVLLLKVVEERGVVVLPPLMFLIIF